MHSPERLDVALPDVVRIDDFDIRVEVSERRRNGRLTVERDAAITATVPPGIDGAELTRLVRSRRRWLYGKVVPTGCSSARLGTTGST